MSKNYRPTDEELALFNSITVNTKKIKQDTVVHSSKKKSKVAIIEKKQQQEKNNNEFYFSDNFQPLLQDDPIRYSREDAELNDIKKLKRGFYEPEFFLDLHGLTQNEAKKEIAALITVCIKERASCACVMYGHGKNILNGLGIVLSPSNNPGFLPGMNAGAFNLGAGLSFALLPAIQIMTDNTNSIGGYFNGMLLGLVITVLALLSSFLIPRPIKAEVVRK